MQISLPEVMATLYSLEKHLHLTLSEVLEKYQPDPEDRGTSTTLRELRPHLQTNLHEFLCFVYSEANQEPHLRSNLINMEFKRLNPFEVLCEIYNRLSRQ